MSHTASHAQNIYQNAVVGATANIMMPEPDAIDETFASDANAVLCNAAEIARQLVGAHQSAIAIIVQGDWSTARKYFSLSEKYRAWADYKTPATGFGIHNWLLKYNKPIRFTQEELEAHPEWQGFGTEAGKHPPMRGWMAIPLIDRDGVNWGLFQLSDKYEGDFTAQDEETFVRFGKLVSTHLEALWEIRNFRKGVVPLSDGAGPVSRFPLNTDEQ